VIASVIGAFVIGAIFLFCLLLGIHNLPAAIKGGFGPANIIDSNFGSAMSAAFLTVVSAAIFVCCLAIETSTIRLCFGMARDDQLPGSKALAKVNTRLHTPIASCVVIGLVTGLAFVQYAGVFILAIGATAMIYLSYLIGSLALMRARLGGWPKVKAPFSLGRWGIPLTALALAWGGGMLVNFAWPRIQSNPTPNQAVDAKGHLTLNFGWHWLDRQPVLWTTFIVIVLVGALYFLLVQRRKPSHIQAPEGEALAATTMT